LKTNCSVTQYNSQSGSPSSGLHTCCKSLAPFINCIVSNNFPWCAKRPTVTA